MKNYLFMSCLQIVLTISWLQSTTAQDSGGYDSELKKFRGYVSGQQFEQVRKLGAPEIEDFIAIAERAKSRIFTPQNNELRQMARELDEKLSSLQESSLGRWVAQRPNVVATFIKLDTEYSQLSDEALNLRKDRLTASIDALRQYSVETQGKFDPVNNGSARAILEDANWVEEHYISLRSRLAAIADYESNFPQEEDWSKHPTLREAKNARIARMFEEIQSAEQAGLDEANKINSEKIAQSAFEREIQKTNTKLAGDEMLSELERKLMEAEFGRLETEYDRRIMETRLAKEKIQTKMATTEAEAAQENLNEYLQSERVINLLAPFCSKGWTHAHTTTNPRQKHDQLEPSPMSLSRMKQFGAIGTNADNMFHLVQMANGGNDRPGWGVTPQNWNEAEATHRNMKGEMVNPYVEAMRILREHAGVLQELKMLRQ